MRHFKEQSSHSTRRPTLRHPMRRTDTGGDRITDVTLLTDGTETTGLNRNRKLKNHPMKTSLPTQTMMKQNRNRKLTKMNHRKISGVEEGWVEGWEEGLAAEEEWGLELGVGGAGGEVAWEEGLDVHKAKVDLVPMLRVRFYFIFDM